RRTSPASRHRAHRGATPSSTRSSIWPESNPRSRRSTSGRYPDTCSTRSSRRSSRPPTGRRRIHMAYQPLHEKSAVQKFNEWVQKFTFEEGPDGLEVTPPDEFEGPFESYYAKIPPLLLDWLVGLRLLRGVPLTHLVP